MALLRQPALPPSLEAVVVLSVGVLAVVETVEAEVVEVAVTFLDSAPAAAAGTCPYQHCSVDSLVPTVLWMLDLASNSHHHLTSGSPYSLGQQQL
jgi:hypothetical protein